MSVKIVRADNDHFGAIMFSLQPGQGLYSEPSSASKMLFPKVAFLTTRFSTSYSKSLCNRFITNEDDLIAHLGAEGSNQIEAGPNRLKSVLHSQVRGDINAYGVNDHGDDSDSNYQWLVKSSFMRGYNSLLTGYPIRPMYAGLLSVDSVGLAWHEAIHNRGWMQNSTKPGDWTYVDNVYECFVHHTDSWSKTIGRITYEGDTWMFTGLFVRPYGNGQWMAQVEQQRAWSTRHKPMVGDQYLRFYVGDDGDSNHTRESRQWWRIYDEDCSDWRERPMKFIEDIYPQWWTGVPRDIGTGICYTKSIGTCLYDDDQILEMITEHLHFDELSWRKFDSGVSWRNLAYNALQNIGMSTNNGIAFLKDCASMAQDFKEQGQALNATYNLVKKTKGAKAAAIAVKAAAGVYLSVHYGWKLQMLDTQDYAKHIRKMSDHFGESRVQAVHHATVNNYTVVQRYQIFYNNFVEGQRILNEFLAQLDLWPTTENAWDLVPYSFVIDWFFNIGDKLQALDNYYHVVQYYKVHGAGGSITATRPIQASELPDLMYCEFNLEHKYYARRYFRYVHDPLPDTSSTPSPFHHWLEGLALFIQRW